MCYSIITIDLVGTTVLENNPFRQTRGEGGEDKESGLQNKCIEKGQPRCFSQILEDIQKELVNRKH